MSQPTWKDQWKKADSRRRKLEDDLEMIKHPTESLIAAVELAICYAAYPNFHPDFTDAGWRAMAEAAIKAIGNEIEATSKPSDDCCLNFGCENPDVCNNEIGYSCGDPRAAAPIYSKPRDIKKTLLGVAVDDPNLIGPGTDMTNVFPEEEP